MHLINATTYALEYFVGSEIPKYAILSHVWGKEEVLFRDLQRLKSARKKEGFVKIHYMCQQALRDGLQYTWVDTCCINKESSAELSEAINSMFKWYSRAERCYAYLSDLEVVPMGGIHPQTHPPLANSRWFTRGWTLQELIAPSDVTFVDRDWTLIGAKKGSLLEEINRVTGIDKEVLASPDTMFRMTIAKRMSWAAKRKTTRKEDEAYCLLGLFNVNMPMLYGEEDRAFIRLQEELIRTTNDQSVFVHRGKDGNLLAQSPQDFDGFADVSPCLDLGTGKPYELTNTGLRITLPILTSSSYHVSGVLNCHRKHHRLVLNLQRREVGHRKCLDPMRTRKIDDVEMAMLLSCPVEEVFIARAPEDLIDWISDPQSGLLIARLWLHPANKAGNLDIAIKSLVPPKSWDIAAPPNVPLGSRIRSSELLACFNLYSSSYKIPAVGIVTFDLTDGTSEPIPLMIHFQLRVVLSRGIQRGYCCDLDLCEAHLPRPESGTPSEHGAHNSIKSQWLKPESRIRVMLRVKRLKITAVLEVGPDLVGWSWMVGSNVVLHLQADETDEDSAILDETFEPTE